MVRIRRARGDQVRQLRWLVYAVVMAGVLLAAGLLLFDSPLPGLLALPLIPVAAGFAILKFRLYDIDPVINKTLVVGVMLLLITAGYVAIVVGVGALVPADERVLSLVTTAAVAVAFEPLRRRAQRLADRLVYGHRTTPYQALSQLSSHLEDAPQELLDGVAATVANAVGADEVTVWVGGEERLVPQGWWPAPAAEQGPAALADLGGPRTHARPVVHRNAVRGAITLRKVAGDSLTAAEDRLLADLAAQTGADHRAAAASPRTTSRSPPYRHRRGRGPSAHRARPPRRSPAAAGHPGIGTGVLAEQAKAKAKGDDATADRVKEARTQLLEATAELRELARGLHPMVLAQSGLEPALGTLADRSAIPARLHVAVPETLSPPSRRRRTTS